MADRLLLNGRVLDIERAELRDAGGQIVPLRAQALSVLLVLARRRGEIVPKRELLAQVWPGVVVTDDSLVQCVVDIRRELGDTGQRIVRTLPRRGYVLIADDTDAPADEPSADDSRPSSRRRVVAAAAAIGLVAAVALSTWWFDVLGARHRAGSADGAVVAVLPLRERNVTISTVVAGEGLAFLIAGELARNADLHVVSTLVAVELRAKGMSARQIGTVTGARYVVDGSVERTGNRLALDLQLIDTTDDRIAWSTHVQPTAEEMPGTTRLLIEQISVSLGSTVRELRRSVSLSHVPASLDAHALALHGAAVVQAFPSPELLRQARKELETVTRLDPGNALAWSHLGLVKTLLINSRNDPQLGPQDRDQALDEIRKGIELDPLLASSWRALSVAIDSGKDPGGALQAAERAVELGPGDPENWLVFALAHYHAGQLDVALRHLEKALAWNRGLRPPSYSIVEARLRYAAQDYAQAARSARECMERVPVLVVCKAIWLSSQFRTGHGAEAEAAWPRLVAAAPWLEKYRYSPRGTREARLIDDDLDRLRNPAAALR
jgi:DNA-binding winged helix-turn-helix (wHTH) protein/TolB-like protein